MNIKIDTCHFFVSDSIDNIWIGYGTKKWAVPAHEDKTRKAYLTRSENTIGNISFFYEKETGTFTTPFVITSRPNNNGIMILPVPTDPQNRIWTGEWYGEFNIDPFGTPNTRVSKDEFEKALGCTFKYQVFPFSSLELTPNQLSVMIELLGDLSNPLTHFLLTNLRLKN